MGDEQDRHPLVLLQRLDQLQDLRLDGHVQRRRRLVRDQQPRVAGQRHGDHHALAHPAGKAVRIVVEPRLGRRDAHLFQQADGFRLGRGPRQPPVQHDRFGNLRADGQHRVKRGHRLLKDHRDLVAADGAHLVGRQLQQIAAVKDDLALDAAIAGGRQLHDGHGRHAFARAGFADHGQGLVGVDVERDVAHHRLPARIGPKGGGQVAQGKNRVRHGFPFTERGAGPAHRAGHRR